MVIDVQTLIRELQLEPHPEGGHYRRIHDGYLSVASEVSAMGRRMAVSAIHFLLDRGEHARWHRVRQEELWHHAAGGPMVLQLIDPACLLAKRIVIGSPAQGFQTLLAIPPGWWQAAFPLDDPSLCSCIVAPSFDFSDHTFLKDDPASDQVKARFPELVHLQ